MAVERRNMAKKTASEKADKIEKPDKGSTSGDKGAGDKTPVENEEQPVELGKYSDPVWSGDRFSFAHNADINRGLLLLTVIRTVNQKFS